jgi:hypothetical protein
MLLLGIIVISYFSDDVTVINYKKYANFYSTHPSQGEVLSGKVHCPNGTIGHSYTIRLNLDPIWKWAK